MARKSYREHRAERTAALSDDGTDLDSLASFSTFASHTTLASHAPGTYPSFSSFGIDGGSSPYYSQPSGLAPPTLRQRTYSNVSSLSRRDASLDSIGTPSTHSRFLSPPPSDVPTPSGLPPSSAPPPSRSVSGEDVVRPRSKEDLERDKRRRRARNEERWRRARAREAAHDAPVRRVAKAANSILGPVWTQAVAFFACVAVRIFLTIAMLWLDDSSQTRLSSEAAALRLACAGRVAPLLRPLVPLCRATFGDAVDNSNAWPGTGAVVAVIGLRLAAESLLWSAAVVWASVEGWREGRTLRTKVTAIVYLALSPVLVIREAAFLPVRSALGFAAWALVATVSGYDTAAAALMTIASWFEGSTRVYIPAFAVYAVGKNVWLNGRDRGYLGRLAVTVLATLFVLGSMSPVPLRERGAAIAAAIKVTSVSGCIRALLRRVASIISFRNIISTIALLPSTYLTLKSSYTLRPAAHEPASADVVPATARLLPIALTATAGALTLLPVDPALPLLPLAFASALRRDDDEWAVAVQMHHVAAMSLWPALSGILLTLASGYVLAWNMLIGARTDAPSPMLSMHQKTTLVLNLGASVWPLFAHLHLAAHFKWAAQYVGHALTTFMVLSVVGVVVWANMRLVKTAWAAGAL
ncbi:hypothetical protein CcaverHIS002_0400280 [Cutaneotrichosporon cavernicola]|nr:hypothetical protein CcaverHIS002_0400280 [Cutaneotrichosporon cavernicola]BEI98981.1 hypothetical protein CcaverHIS631_0400240 [Cutaneotrichosporon cavernicola]BEJ06755.1 hypothetical protein CcaverHIS641_0400240 [Cutaneotrichosporon cavernicola]